MTYIKIYENVYLSIFDDDLILSWKIRFKQIKNKEEKKNWKENVIKDIYYDFYDTFDNCNRQIDPELKIKAKKFFSEIIVPLFCKEYNKEIEKEAYCINKETGNYLYSVTMDRIYPAFVSKWKEAWWSVPHDYKTAIVLAEKMKSKFYFKEKVD